MGQRTQLVVEVTKVTEDYTTKKKTKKTYVGSYHNQWGIGKMQLFDVIRMVTSYVDSMDEEYTFPERLHKAYLLNGKEYENPFKGKATPERVMKWLNTQDNNNGGMLLKLKVDRFNYIESGELYFFNDPETEGSRYCEQHPEDEDAWYNFKVDRQISLLEYINYMPEYFNEPFITAFTALMRFYNIQIMEPKPKED